MGGETSLRGVGSRVCLNTKYSLPQNKSALGRNEGDLRKGTTAGSWERMGFTDSNGRKEYPPKKETKKAKEGHVGSGERADTRVRVNK